MLPQSLEELDSFFESTISNRLAADKPAGTLSLVKELFAGTPKESVTDARKLLNERRMDLLDNDLGLNLTASYINNVQDGVFENERASYNSNSYVGLEWDILKEGLLQRGAKKRALEKEIRIQDLLEPELRKDEEFSPLYYRIIYTFNTAKIERLGEWAGFLDKYIEAAERLYLYKYYGWEDIIKLKREKALARNMLKNCISFNKAMPDSGRLPSVEAERLPVADMDMQKLASMSADHDVNPGISALEKEKARELDGAVNNIYLRAFARYYTSDMLSESSSDNMAVGLYFKMPLPYGAKERDRFRAAEDSLTDLSLRKKSIYKLNKLQDVYYEYQYKLNDIYTFSFKKALVEERLRKERVKMRFKDPAYNPLQTMSLLNELYALEFEFLDIKQQLYLKLLEAYRHSANIDLFAALSVVDLNGPVRKFPGVRSAYVWSSSFNSLEDEFLLWYLKNQEIGEIMLSSGENTDQEKIKAFLHKAGKNSIRVNAMIGGNELLFREKRGSLRAKVEAASLAGFAGVHLDIEPHTFEDWGTKKDIYIKQYLDMLSFVKVLAGPKGMELSVSIPVHLPENSLNGIFGLADRVFVMAYGTKDMAVLKRRLDEELKAGMDKVTIALRPLDFDSRAEFERFLKNVIAELGVERVAVHDIKGLLRIDEININQNLNSENPN